MGRRGRKRNNVKREPNGRASRHASDVLARLSGIADKEQIETMSVAMEARQRVYGIGPEFLASLPKRTTLDQVLRDQLAGTAIGRYCLCGVVTRSQYDAAMKWQEDRAEYLRAVAPAQGSEPRALNPNAVHGSSNYENIGAVRKAVDDYREAAKAVMAKQIEVGQFGNLNGALDAIIVRDQQLEHLVGDLRIALNALVKHYGLEGRVAA